MYLMPVLPFLTDTEEMLERTVERAVEAGVGFIVFGGLTLRPGRQQEHFLSVLRGIRPDLEERCRRLYPGDKWGRAAGGHFAALERRFGALARKHRVPPRMPPGLYAGILSPADLAVVTLEHLDHLLRLLGERSSFGEAARIVARQPELACEAQQDLFPGRGAGPAPAAAAVLDELRRTGRSTLLESLLGG
jgi:hypothetical protein